MGFPLIELFGPSLFLRPFLGRTQNSSHLSASFRQLDVGLQLGSSWKPKSRETCVRPHAGGVERRRVLGGKEESLELLRVLQRRRRMSPRAVPPEYVC